MSATRVLTHAGSLARVDSSIWSNEELQRGLDHAGSRTRTHENEAARRLDEGWITRVPLPAYEEKQTMESRGVKQRGIVYLLAWRRNLDDDPTRVVPDRFYASRDLSLVKF